MALFDDNGMRASQKSKMYQSFQESDVLYDKNNSVHVIDGGFLLRKVLWERGETYSVICEKYVAYIERNYGKNCSIVFDGYANTKLSTKSALQSRRYRVRASAEVIFDGSTAVTVTQAEFMRSNEIKCD